MCKFKYAELIAVWISTNNNYPRAFKEFEMSSSSKPEKTKKGFGIVAIVKRKRSKKASSKDSLGSNQQKPSTLPSPLEPDTSNIQVEGASVSESIDFGGPELQDSATMATMKESQVAELSKQLTEAYDDLDLAESKIEEDTKQIAALEGELDKLRKKSTALESKVAEFENVSADLDDDSFTVAQEFQYKKQIDDLKEKLEKRKKLEQELFDTKVELQETKAQYDAIQFQRERSTTRDKMKNLSQEKTSKDEVVRLQKELRTTEHKLQLQKSTLEAQQKASLDSIQRIQQKNKAIQKRCDELEKERLHFKLENGRLEKKLEKSGSYSEKKRIQTEQEAAAMELKNMQRKNAKLEKRLSMSTQMLDLIGQGSSMILDGASSPTRSESSSGVTSPVPITLSEARIMNLEKEIQQMEAKLSKFEEENHSLLERATTAEMNVEGLTMKLKEVDSKLFQEKEANNNLETKTESLRQQTLSPIGEDDSPQAKIQQLETEIEQNAVKFRVKEKDLWATIEAQKRQVTELEMEKISLEERLLEDDSTDVEDDQAEEKSATTNEKVGALEEQLSLMRDNNEALQAEVEQLKSEAAEFMQSLESELGDVTDTSQEEIVTDLKQSLKERTIQYEDTIREIARLKNIIEEQVRLKCFNIYRAGF